MATDLDVSQYMQLPTLDAAATCALAQSLLSAALDDDRVKPAAKAAKASLKALQAALGPVATEASERTPKAVDTDVDVAWGSMYRRLQSLGELARFDAARAARAGALLAKLFPPPEGARFLTDPFASEWQKVKSRLAVISDDDLEPEIVDLAGPEYTSLLRSTFAEYGDVLHITSAAPEVAEQARVRAAFVELRDDLRDLAIATLATRKKGDAKSLKKVKAALLPIDEARARVTTSPSAPEGPPAPPPPVDPNAPPADEAVAKKSRKKRR
ncbi:MAG TPA: hypothetical protein VGM56_10365 [Byssovorax sp.]